MAVAETVGTASKDFRVLLEGCGKELAIAAGLSVASGALDIVCMSALPLFLLFALSGGTPPHVPDLLLGWGIALTPSNASAAIALLFLFRGAFALVVGSRLAALATGIRGRIVARLGRAYATAAFERAATRSVDEAVSAAMGHAQHFAESGVMPLLRLALDSFTIVAVLAFLLFVQPQFVLSTLIILLAVGLINFSLIRRANDRNAQRQVSLEGRLAHEVTLLLSAPREVRIFQLGDYVNQRLGEIMESLRLIRGWFGAIYWLPRVLGELTLIGLAIAFMFHQSAAGADPTRVVSTLGLLGYAGVRLLPAFAQSMASVSSIRSAYPTARLLARTLSEKVAVQNPRGPFPDAEAPFRELELRDVSFTYMGSMRPALHGISATVHAGQSMGLIGPSGAGKSTLADLIMGLLVPTQGEIRVNGTPVRLCGPAWWKRVGFVAQMPFIANDTLRRNIAFGIRNGEIDDARVQQAVQMAQLESTVAGLPQGLDTPLGERGNQLSGGQRQRVAIARALYRHCELLVLDEATSALDPATERDVIDAISQLKGRVTLLVIAHRISTLKGCDRIMELRAGLLQLLEGADSARVAGSNP